MKSFVLHFSSFASIVPTGTMLPPFLSQHHSSPLLAQALFTFFQILQVPTQSKNGNSDGINLNLPEIYLVSSHNVTLLSLPLIIDMFHEMNLGQ